VTEEAVVPDSADLIDSEEVVVGHYELLD